MQPQHNRLLFFAVSNISIVNGILVVQNDPRVPASPPSHWERRYIVSQSCITGLMRQLVVIERNMIHTQETDAAYRSVIDALNGLEVQR